jgi:ankyrin repeat protein
MHVSRVHLRAVSVISALLVAAIPIAASAQGSASRDVRLFDAAQRGDHAAMKQLLQARVDVNAPAADGATALHAAVERDDVDAVALLLTAGADVKAVNRFGVAPLVLAATNGNAAIAGRLLDAGASPDTALPQGDTVLMIAARTGRPEVVKRLIAAGADVNGKERGRGQTALMWAAAENHAEVVRLLVEGGAEIEARSNGGFTPLHFAVRGGKADAVRALLSRGANVNDPIRPPTQPPGAGRGAAPAGGGGAAAGAGAAAAGAAGGAATAAIDPRRRTLEQVMISGQRGRGSATAGASPLHLAILNAHFELAAELLDRGADPNANGTGWTPLHQVAWTRRPPIQHGLPPAVPTGALDSLELAKKAPGPRRKSQREDDARAARRRAQHPEPAWLDAVSPGRQARRHSLHAAPAGARRRCVARHRRGNHGADGRRRRRYLAGG